MEGISVPQRVQVDRACRRFLFKKYFIQCVLNTYFPILFRQILPFKPFFPLRVGNTILNPQVQEFGCYIDLGPSIYATLKNLMSSIASKVCRSVTFWD